MGQVKAEKIKGNYPEITQIGLSKETGMKQHEVL